MSAVEPHFLEGLLFVKNTGKGEPKQWILILSTWDPGNRQIKILLSISCMPGTIQVPSLLKQASVYMFWVPGPVLYPQHCLRPGCHRRVRERMISP